MKSHISSWPTLGLAVAVPMWLLGASIAHADQKAGASGGGGTTSAPASTSSSGGGGGGHASSGGSGGGHASSGGGGGHATASGGGGHAAASGGGHATASGSGTAHAGAGAGSRAHGPSDSSTGSAVPRGSTGTAATGAGTKAGDRATYRDDPTTRKGGDTVPPYSRPRDGNPIVGQAVPRESRPPVMTGGGPIYVPGGYWSGYYPWGYGGLGVAGFYSSFYDPCYDPYDYGFACGGGYGGYGSYSGYGGYGSYGGSGSYGAYGGTSDPQTSSGSAEEGSIHLKVKPRDASVFVDGYYVGLVDDFDGVFQKLHMEAGPHRLEVRAPGYETLTFDVRVEPDKTTTYKGELRKIQ